MRAGLGELSLGGENRADPQSRQVPTGSPDAATQEDG